MHCLNQKKWKDPRDLTRAELDAEIREITNLLKQSEFEIENYDAIHTRYTDWKKEDDAIKAHQESIYAELQFLTNRFFGRLIHRAAIARANEKLAETKTRFESLLQKHHGDDPLFSPVDGSIIPVGRYEDYLCWTTSTRAIFPWDVQDKMILGANVDRVFSYEKLMPVEVAIPWLLENEIEPLKARLSELERQLDVRA